MKVLFALGIFTLASNSVFACSPAQPIVMQTGNLDRVMTSEAFKRELKIQMAKDPRVAIASITFKGGVSINLNNGCNIIGSLKYDPPASNGACPTFKEVTALTECQTL
jgi:hypothetical protein